MRVWLGREGEMGMFSSRDNNVREEWRRKKGRNREMEWRENLEKTRCVCERERAAGEKKIPVT